MTVDAPDERDARNTIQSQSQRSREREQESESKRRSSAPAGRQERERGGAGAGGARTPKKSRACRDCRHSRSHSWMSAADAMAHRPRPRIALPLTG